MSDDAHRKRSWFQIHLSTAVVLMVVAGVLLWANVVDVSFDNVRVFRPYEHVEGIGWPLPLYTDPAGDVYWSGPPEYYEQIMLRNWEYSNILINLFTALAILTAVAVGCEGWVRRRARCLGSPLQKKV